MVFIQISNRLLRTSKLKQCNTCLMYKDAIEFNKHIKTKDGLDIKCRACNKHLCKVWSDKNKEAKRATDREYYANNKEAQLSRAATWRIDNAEHVIAYRQQKTLEGYFLVRQHARRTDMLDSEDIASQKETLDVKREYDTCFWCNCSLEYPERTLDHVVPIAKGGKHTVENLVVACRSCNSKKRSKDPEDFATEIGWSIEELYSKLSTLQVKE